MRRHVARNEQSSRSIWLLLGNRADGFNKLHFVLIRVTLRALLKALDETAWYMKCAPEARELIRDAVKAIATAVSTMRIVFSREPPLKDPEND